MTINVNCISFDHRIEICRNPQRRLFFGAVPNLWCPILDGKECAYQIIPKRPEVIPRPQMGKSR